jgi:hypothetical protein
VKKTLSIAAVLAIVSLVAAIRLSGIQTGTPPHQDTGVEGWWTVIDSDITYTFVFSDGAYWYIKDGKTEGDGPYTVQGDRIYLTPSGKDQFYYTYKLSPDGKTLSLSDETGEALFQMDTPPRDTGVEGRWKYIGDDITFTIVFSDGAYQNIKDGKTVGSGPYMVRGDRIYFTPRGKDQLYYTYKLSPDGKTLSLGTEMGEALFQREP